MLAAKNYALVTILLCALLASHSNAQAAVNAECDLSGTTDNSLAACPSSPAAGFHTASSALTGNGTCNGSYCGVRSHAGAAAIIPIDVWGLCRWVDNSSANSIFVPFKSSREWRAFLTAAPGLNGIDPIHCAEPYAETNAAATVTTAPNYADCTTTTVNAPNVYGRTGTSLWPAPAVSAAFTCHNGATSMQSSLQWKGGDADTTTTGNLSWVPLNYFSPDLTLIATDDTNSQNSGRSISVDSGVSVTLTWATGGVANQTWSCVASDGWSGTKTAGGGSEQITPGSDPTYTISCKDNYGLVSVTNATVNVKAVPPNNKYAGSKTYLSTGHDQTWTVPAGVTWVKFQVWGGYQEKNYSESICGYVNGGNGGNGYVQAEFPVGPNSKIHVGDTLRLMVGAPGIAIHDANSVVKGGYGFGGNGFAVYNTSGQFIVTGSGLSSVFTPGGPITVSDVNQGTALLVAGGSGGVAYQYSTYITRSLGAESVGSGTQSTASGEDATVDTRLGQSNPGGGGGFRGGSAGYLCPNLGRYCNQGDPVKQASSGSNYVDPTGLNPINMAGVDGSVTPVAGYAYSAGTPNTKATSITNGDYSKIIVSWQ